MHPLTWGLWLAVLAASETTTATRGFSDGIIVALIGVIGLVASAFIQKSGRNRIGDDQMIVNRRDYEKALDELDELRTKTEKHRAR